MNSQVIDGQLASNTALQAAQGGDGLIWVTVLIFLAAFAVVSVLILIIINNGDRAMEARRRVIAARAKGKAEEEILRQKQQEAYAKQKQIRTRKGIHGPDDLFEAILPKKEALQKHLRQAGVDISPGRYLTLSLFIGCVAYIGALGGLNQTLPMAALIGIGLGILLPRMVLDKLTLRRRSEFQERLADALDLMVRSLKAGLPINQAMQAVAQEIKGPLAEEFQAVSDEVRLGKEIEDSLWASAERMQLPDFRFFVISVSVQRQTGGNLAETLDNLGEIVRKRRQLHLKIRALSSEARASAMIIGSLPFVMLGMLYTMNRDYVMTLFTDPRGHLLLMLGLGLLTVGGLVMRKMVKFEV